MFTWGLCIRNMREGSVRLSFSHSRPFPPPLASDGLSGTSLVFELSERAGHSERGPCELDRVGGRLAGGGSGSSRHVDCGCVYCWCVRKGCRGGVVEGGGCCWWRGVLWMCKIIESRKARELIYSSSASTISLCGACAGVG